MKSLNSGRAIAILVLSVWQTFACAFRYAEYNTAQASWDQVVYQFSKDAGLLSAALCVALFFLNRYFALRRIDFNPARNKTAVALSFTFALLLIVGRAFTATEVDVGAYGSFDPMFSSAPILVMTIIAFAGLWSLLYSVLAFAYQRLASIRSLSPKPSSLVDCTSSAAASDDAGHTVARRIAGVLGGFFSTAPSWRLSLLLALCWVPYIVVFFPGCIYHDSADQLCQFFGVQPLSAHHPLVTTYVFGGLVSVGRLLGSDNLGVFLCTAFQVAILSYACAQVIVAIRVFARPSWRVLLIAFLLFAFVPLWGSAATSIKKDALFYAAFALFVVKLFDIAWRSSKRSCGAGFKPRDLILLCIWGLVTSLVRNDGVLFVVVATACFTAYFLACGKHARSVVSRLAVSCVAILLVYVGGYKVIAMNVTNAQSGSPVEALTIPIQQVARYYIEAPSDVTPEMDEGISRVLDTSGLSADVYNPLVSDNIKFGFAKSDIGMSDLLAFGGAYLKMGLEHPVLFLEAFIDQTSGWWYPEHLGKPDWTVGNMGLYQNTPKTEIYSQVLDVSMPVYDTALGQGFKRLIGSFGYIPGIGLLVYPAIWVWCLLFLLGAFWTLDRKADLLLVAPLLFYAAICVASPVNGLTRYMVPVIIARHC